MSTRTESLAETDRKPTQKLVYDALFLQPPRSRAELARITGLRLSSVCGRVNELIEAGEVVVCGTVWDADTARNVEAVTIA